MGWVNFLTPHVGERANSKTAMTELALGCNEALYFTSNCSSDFSTLYGLYMSVNSFLQAQYSVNCGMFKIQKLKLKRQASVR